MSTYPGVLTSVVQEITQNDLKEENKMLRKMLTEFQEKAKSRHRQAFQLSCQLKQEKDNSIEQAKNLALEKKAHQKVLAEVTILKEGIQFVNSQFIKIIQDLANFGEKSEKESGESDWDGWQVKLKVSGGSSRKMYSNPKSHFQKLFKSLTDTYTSELSSLEKEVEEVDECANKWKNMFLNFVNEWKNGQTNKKRKREAEDTSQEEISGGNHDNRQDSQISTVRDSPRRSKRTRGIFKDYGCPICQQMFYDWIGLTTHVEKKHKDGTGLVGNSGQAKKRAKRMASK